MSYLKDKKKQISILLAVFLASVAVGIFLQGFFSVKKDDGTEEMPKAEAVEDKVINFLLVGVDDREDNIGRSDTMLVLSFNPARSRAELISVPRDSRVSIPLHGETKLNHSYAYGGVRLTKQMVEKTIGIHIDNYFVFNFKGFKNAMEAIGGVDMDVEKDMYYRDDWDDDGGLVIDLKKGQQHLDAEKSIEYVRYRDGEGDIGRVKRQQKFLKAVSEKLLSAESIPKLPTIIRGIYQNIETDMSFSDCLKLASMLKDSSAFEIHSMTVPGKPEMIDELSYWIIDGEKLEQELKIADAFLRGESIVAGRDDDTSKDADQETDETSIFHDNEMIDLDTAKWEKDDNKLTEKDFERIKAADMRERQDEIAFLEAARNSLYGEPKRDAHQETIKDDSPKKKATVINATGSDNGAESAASALRAQGFSVNTILSSSVSETSSAVLPEGDAEVSSMYEKSGIGIKTATKPSGETTVIVGKDESDG